MAKPQQKKILLGLSGEFAVASHLCLKGYVVSLTLKNYPGVDIFVVNPQNNRNTAIQVKTKIGGKLYFTPKNISETDYPFIFVYFTSEDQAPEFYVVPARSVAEISKREMELYRESHPNMNKEKQPHMISLKGIREFKDKWENLGLD